MRVERGDMVVQLVCYRGDSGKGRRMREEEVEMLDGVIIR